MKILGERMKQLREESGFSQNKLAKLVGLPQSSINRYESGFSNPAPETLVWYADYFDVSLVGRTSLRGSAISTSRSLIQRWQNS